MYLLSPPPDEETGELDPGRRVHCGFGRLVLQLAVLVLGPDIIFASKSVNGCGDCGVWRVLVVEIPIIVRGDHLSSWERLCDRVNDR